MVKDYSSFDHWALTYDDDMRKANDSDDWMFRGYYSILDRIVEYCELDNYENPLVLDIGAGTGNLSEKFLDKKLMVTAIDPSVKMREMCKEKYPDLEILSGDFLDIPLPPESIDIIVSSYAFHHLTDEEKAVSVSLMRDILQPGGRIIIADLMFEDREEKKRIRQFLLESGQSEIVEDIDDEFPGYFNELQGVFTQAGFDVRGEQLTASVWIICAILQSLQSGDNCQTGGQK